MWSRHLNKHFGNISLQRNIFDAFNGEYSFHSDTEVDGPFEPELVRCRDPTFINFNEQVKLFSENN